MAWSTSEDTAIESLLYDYNLDHCTSLDTTLPPPSSPYYLSRLPSLQSHPPSPDLGVDVTKIDPTLHGVPLTLPAGVTQQHMPVFQNDPPPHAAGDNYWAEARAEEHEQLFSKLPPGLDTPGISVPPDSMSRDIDDEIDRLATRRFVTPVPLLADPTGDSNWTSHDATAHPTDANGRLLHGECGLYSCSVCQKSFCKENRLKRHQRSHKKTHVCPICGATRSWANHLARHMATHRNGTVACPMDGCLKTFKTTANIPRHLQNLASHGLTKDRSKQVMAEYKQTLQQAT